jgi:hypothetical protein
METVKTETSQLYTTYAWSDKFKNLSVWGVNLVNEHKAIEVSKITRERHNIVNRVLGKDLPQWIKDLFQVRISHVQLFSAEPGAVGSIHKDGSDRLCAFNIPIMNTNEGWMEWLDGPVEGRLLELDHTSIRLLKDRDESHKLSTTTKILLENPTLINTNEWHRVDNFKNTNWRHVLSVRFMDNPDYSSVKSILDQTLIK